MRPADPSEPLYGASVPYEETLEAFRRGDNDEAQRLAQRDLNAATQAVDTAAQVDALCMLSRVALRLGDLATVTSRADDTDHAVVVRQRTPGHE